MQFQKYCLSARYTGARLWFDRAADVKRSSRHPGVSGVSGRTETVLTDFTHVHFSMHMHTCANAFVYSQIRRKTWSLLVLSHAIISLIFQRAGRDSCTTVNMFQNCVMTSSALNGVLSNESDDVKAMWWSEIWGQRLWKKRWNKYFAYWGQWLFLGINGG